MSRGAFISSAILHGAVLALMAMEFSFARFDKAPPPALLMIDLSKVQISSKTNLPPKVQTSKTVKTTPSKPQPMPKPTKVQSSPPAPPKPKPIPEPVIPKAAPVVEPKKAQPEKKVTPKTPEPKTPTPKKETSEDRFKSLLASVEKVRQKAPVSTVPTEPEELRVSEGIEGGSEGSLSQILTISERDLIANQLSKCWLVDAGKEGIDNMIIEIRTQVNKDGSVRDVKILNMPSDPVKRSVAESARRAVLVCDKKEDESPFKILAEKYADHYGEWKSMILRFNPMTGGVM